VLHLVGGAQDGQKRLFLGVVDGPMTALQECFSRGSGNLPGALAALGGKSPRKLSGPIAPRRQAIIASSKWRE
jgi:hypothetical protein